MPGPAGDSRSDVARHLHGEGVEVETCGAHMESSSVQVAGDHQTDTLSIVPAVGVRSNGRAVKDEAPREGSTAGGSVRVRNTTWLVAEFVAGDARIAWPAGPGDTEHRCRPAPPAVGRQPQRCQPSVSPASAECSTDVGEVLPAVRV